MFSTNALPWGYSKSQSSITKWYRILLSKEVTLQTVFSKHKIYIKKYRSNYLTNSVLHISMMSHNIFICNIKFLVDIILKSITMRSDEFVSELNWKSKNRFFTFLNVYFSQTFRYFTDQNGPKRGPNDNEFWQFSNTNISWTVRVQKVYGKMGSFV